MARGVQTILYPVADPVADLERAKAVHSARLGVAPTMDAPYDVGSNVAGQDVGLDLAGHQQGLTGPSVDWHVGGAPRRQSGGAAGGQGRRRRYADRLREGRGRQRGRPRPAGLSRRRSPGAALMIPPPRTRQQRRRDVLGRLERDVDAWVATADPTTGTPHLVPLSFLWDGETLLFATASATPTARNLLAGGAIRVGVGETRDVVLVEGAVDTLPASDIPDAVGDAFAAKTGFDPRLLTSPYTYFRVRPTRLQAWREVDELHDRELMRGGRWLDLD